MAPAGEGPRAKGLPEVQKSLLERAEKGREGVAFNKRPCRDSNSGLQVANLDWHSKPQGLSGLGGEGVEPTPQGHDLEGFFFVTAIGRVVEDSLAMVTLRLARVRRRTRAF